MRRILPCALILALAPLSPAQEPPPPPKPEPTLTVADVVTRGLEAITPQGLLAHVKALSSPDLKGREAGTPESRRAANYVATQFRKAGCEPLGAENTYFQPFKIPGRLAPAADCSASVIAGQRELGWIPDLDCLPFGAAANAEAGASVVFCGYGVTAEREGYDDFAGIDVTGKVVLCLRYTPRTGKPGDLFPGSSAKRHADLSRKVRLAHARGAIAVLVVAGPDRSQTEQRRLDARGRKTAIPAMLVTTSAVQRALRAVNLDLAALQAPIESTGKPQSRALPILVRLRAAMREVNDLTHNVIGVIRGRDPALRHEALVIGGHYDHVGFGHFGSRTRSTGDIHPGADDNASGTAGVIGIARTLREIDYTPRRSIIFVGFGAEEKGLFGSKHYVKEPVWPLKDTVAMINLDMIGRGADGWCSVNGVGTSPGFRTLIERLNGKVQLTLEFSEGGNAPSDNTWFYRAKIPVLFFFTGTHPEYHSPGDRWELIEREHMTKVVQLTFLTAYVLNEADDRPEYRRNDLSKIPRLRDPTQTRVRQWLGLDADTRAISPGVMVLGVDTGSPAAKAGLQKGDRLTKVGPLRAPTTLMLETVLQRLSAGDSLALHYVRGEAARTVTIELVGPFRTQR